MQASDGYTVEISGTADGGDRAPTLSPREAKQRWIAKIRTSKTETTVSAYDYRLKHFVEWCEDEAIGRMQDITGWELEEYETHRRGRGLKPVILNKELGTLRNFLRYCARIEIVDDDLPEKVVPPDIPDTGEVDETRLRHDRAERLLDYYRMHDETRVRYSRAHTLLALAWYTGARLSGLRGLDVDDFDHETASLEFHHRPDAGTPLKNGRDGERVVGLPDHVAKLVDEYVTRERHDVYDETGRAPLITSQVGRASKNAVRTWMYTATQPCLHTECPHGKERRSCVWTEYSEASKCPSSRSPHQVRTGSITWQLNQGIPPQAVAARVNTSVQVIKKHYDQPDKFEEMEERRREHIHDLGFDGSGGEGA